MRKDTYQKLPLFHFADEIKKRHVKKNLKCVLFGNFGAMNHGDEAILAGEIQELQKLPHISITVVARFPANVEKLHKVNSVSMYAFTKVRREIKKSDFIIVGGGGLINKVERNIKGFLYQLYMLFTFFLLPQLYRKKLYVLGIGIYSNANPLIAAVTMLLLKNANLVTVRDLHSYEFLKKKNIHNVLYKDNSFLMDLSSIEQVFHNDFFKKNYRHDRLNIGISLVKPGNKKQENHLLRELKIFIEKYYKEADFWFYATDFNPVYQNDVNIGQSLFAEIRKELANDVTFHFVPTALSPKVFFSSFKLMNFIVGMRLHSLIFAYRAKRDFVGISYDKKCTSFLESVGKEPLILNNFKAEDLRMSIL